jgi:hypothetical protein
LVKVAERIEPPVAAASRYRDDPVAFVHDCFHWPPGEGPTRYQEEILDAIYRHKRVAVRGPHGLGKTALAAWVVLHFALTRDGNDWKCITTAGAWRQLTKYLWPEINKWLRRVRWDKVGREPLRPREEQLVLSLRLATGEAFAVATADPALIEGAHADCLMYVFDESKSVPDAVFDAAEGAFAGAGPDTGREAYALAISTPGEPVGRFWEIHARRPGFESWWVRHVTVEEAIAAGRVSREWVEERARQWGEGSAIFQNRVLGEFAADELGGIIPLAWVEAAVERWHDWAEAGKPGRVTAIGADIGGGGEGDRTVIAVVYDGCKVDVLRKHNFRGSGTATMEAAGHIARLCEATGAVAYVDVVGIGAGVVARLREQGYPVVAFQAAARTELRDRSGEVGFVNWRAAMWCLGRELLAPDSRYPVALPPDDELIGELVAPRSRMTSAGRLQVEDKEAVRKRIGRSTDCADAVLQALIGPALRYEQERREMAEIRWPRERRAGEIVR